MAAFHNPLGAAPSRRALLAGASTGALAFAVTTGLAQQPEPAARANGPLVWLDMDQQALDDAYDQSKYAPNQQQVTGRYASNSAAVRERLPPQRAAYGLSPVEMLDIYATKRAGAPINIFIHGGAWRGGEARNFAFPAELFVNAGAHYVVPDFVNVIDSKGDLMPMAEQVRRVIAWVFANAASFGGDAKRIYVSGHSSGAHLAGVALVTEWDKEFSVPGDVVKGALLCSGMYDLKPVRLSARSSYIKFTDAMEDALSAQRHLARINCPVMVAHGTFETPEFQRQTRDFAAAMKAAGKPVQLLVAPGYNHFEIAETLANPYGALGRAALEQMKLGGA